MDSQMQSDADRLRLLALHPSGLSDELLVRKTDAVFSELLLGELRRLVQYRIGVSAFMMCLCAIDFLASLRIGDRTHFNDRVDFVREYLPPAYDGTRLAKMRDSLLHNYASPPDAYRYTVGRERAAEHLADEVAPRIILDLLVDDIERAGKRLFREAMTEPAFGAKVAARARKPGLPLMEPEDFG